MFGSENLLLSSPWMLCAALAVAACSVLETLGHHKWYFVLTTALSVAGAVALLLFLNAALSDLLLLMLWICLVRVALLTLEGRRKK